MTGEEGRGLVTGKEGRGLVTGEEDRPRLKYRQVGALRLIFRVANGPRHAQLSSGACCIVDQNIVTELK